MKSFLVNCGIFLVVFSIFHSELVSSTEIGQCTGHGEQLQSLRDDLSKTCCSKIGQNPIYQRAEVFCHIADMNKRTQFAKCCEHIGFKYKQLKN